jgi:hypothetical protein
VISDDGLPTGGGLTVRWRLRDGPADAWFDEAQSALTSVSFQASGRHELELSVSDSQFETVRLLRVTVVDPVTLTLTGEQFVETLGYWEAVNSGQAIAIGRPLLLRANLSGTSDLDAWTFAFFDGATPLAGGEAGTLELGAPAAGSHAFQVRGAGPFGLETLSESLVVHVTALPEIEPLAPAANLTVAFDQPVTIQATAHDPDGEVVLLAAYFGPWLIAEVAGD